MKKTIIFLLSLTMVCTFTACNKDKKSGKQLGEMTLSDSLQHVLDLRDNEINEMLSLFNDVQQGFDEINEAEGRINMIRNGERSGGENAIREDIKFIKDRMAQNRELIESLQQQLRESTFKGDELKRSIEGLVAQLEEKNRQLTILQQQLADKDVTIAQQGQKITDQENTITDLNNNVTTLNTQVDEQKAENQRKQEEINRNSQTINDQKQTINDQTQAINTAWYCFGTKSELKAQNILVKGNVLQGNYNKNFFTKIDIRTTKSIKLNSKSAEILTTHPSDSYQLQKDANGQYVLHITDHQRFWSVSKYLVIRVK